MDKISIKFIKPMNTLVIKNEEGRGLFTSSNNSLVISIPNLASLLKFLILHGFLNVKVLEGLIEEYYTYLGNNYYQRKYTEKE